MKKLMIIILVGFALIAAAQTKFRNINEAIAKGEFKSAVGMITQLLQKEDLTFAEKEKLRFEIERMERIRKDFRKTKEDILKYIRQFYPGADNAELVKWENDGSLEYKYIDGEKFYFNRAHTNLFRVNEEAKRMKENVVGKKKDDIDIFLEKYLPKVVDAVKISGSTHVMPVEFKIDYRIVVNIDAVPPGEIIRAWLPYPREVKSRQVKIELISMNPDEFVIADNSHQQRSIYFEKHAVKGEPTVFEFSIMYTGYNVWNKLEAGKVKPYEKSSTEYLTYTAERKPHIVFTDKIKELSEKIVGEETNPLIIAKKIYEWINDNIPWAGAREYSTIYNLSDYCLNHGWGDCGIQTLTFMTLCRYNGIPTKWQSGWMFHPGDVNLHDWGQVYFEGYGWVPVDQSFKLVDSDNDDVRWFYLGGIDAFHFIANDDYSSPLYPAKIFPRSETVDFQRGEVEWRGGNLYFDQWDYFMDVQYLSGLEGND